MLSERENLTQAFGGLHPPYEGAAVEVQNDPGQLFVVPKGVQHRPRAEDEVHIMLIEASGTPNNGDLATAAPRQII